MLRNNRSDYAMLLDQREEVIITGILRACAEGEAEIERLRQRLCENPDFEPYAAFKALQQRPMTSWALTAKDISRWLQVQYYKNCILEEHEVQAILEQYAEGGYLRYEGFLKMILPKEDKAIRSMVMCRRSSGSGVEVGELSRDAGYHLIRLMEAENSLYNELTLRKKRLLEYQWRENRDHICQRSFTWLQSHSAVPGVCHVSVLGVCRLLVDVKETLTVNEVERIFHRANSAGTDMLNYVEWEKFLHSAEANAYLNELYVKYFTTMCPGCGSSVQRDGGACRNVTCSVCRTTFRCETDTATKSADLDSPVTIRSYNRPQSANYSNNNNSPRSSGRKQPSASNGDLSMSRSRPNLSPRNKFSPYDRNASTPAKKKMAGASPSYLSQTVSTAAPTDSLLERSMLSTYGVSPKMTSEIPVNKTMIFETPTLNDESNLNNYSTAKTDSYSRLMKEREDAAFDRQLSVSQSKYSRQKASLRLVVDCMMHQMNLDVALEAQKEALWESGLNIEATFAFLDRYTKSYLADADIWQVMHTADSPGPVSFSGVCSLFRDHKAKDSSKPGQLAMAELTTLMFPKACEECQNMENSFGDAEARNVLWIVRNTLACPGCNTRCQRTVEGCPSVTCSVCRTTFRCTLIGDDRDQVFKLSLTQKYQVKKFLKYAVESAEEQEKIRKDLACSGYSGESLSSVLLDSFLLMADDKGYCNFTDFRRSILMERDVSTLALELLWARYARGKAKLGFVEFAQQLRPFGSS